jgi:hypothetical protein
MAKEPSTGWNLRDLGDNDMVVWEGGDTPVSIPAKSVGQFRVETDFKSNTLHESLMVIQALTSEGKLSVQYSVSSDSGFPLINTFYTNSTSAPRDWTYIIEGIPQNTQDQIFNATIQNSGTTMLSKVKLLILVPADFTDVTDVSAGTGGWNSATISENPDGSHIIHVETSSSTFTGGTEHNYQFSADIPAVNDDKLYVFQTTTIYPSFTGIGKIELASALSEAGVEVVP